VSTYCGGTRSGHSDGARTASVWSGPFGLALDADAEALIVADGNRLRRVPITEDAAAEGAELGLGLEGLVGAAPGAGAAAASRGELGVVMSVAGSDRQAYADGKGSNAEFSGPGLLATDSQLNCYVPEW
jgi:hypothetical protein